MKAAGLLVWFASIGVIASSGCTRQSRAFDAGAADAAADPLAIVDAGADAPVVDAAAPDTRTIEARFAGACMRWHTWSTPETDECDQCRAASCFEWAFRAEANAATCPGQYECVQDTCYPDGSASSIECGCVLTCMTSEACRLTWLGAMECVAENCGEECGEIPPD